MSMIETRARTPCATNKEPATSKKVFEELNWLSSLSEAFLKSNVCAALLIC